MIDPQAIDAFRQPVPPPDAISQQVFGLEPPLHRAQSPAIITQVLKRTDGVVLVCGHFEANANIDWLATLIEVWLKANRPQIVLFNGLQAEQVNSMLQQAGTGPVLLQAGPLAGRTGYRRLAEEFNCGAIRVVGTMAFLEDRLRQLTMDNRRDLGLEALLAAWVYLRVLTVPELCDGGTTH